LKRRTILSEDEQNQRKKKYEENQPERKFNKNWKEGRQWLQYHEFTNVMRGTRILKKYSIYLI
jgi:hypothetical protein